VPNPAARPTPASVVPPAPKEQPIYRVYLPPLSFDAKAPDAEPDPDPAHIILVREAAPLTDSLPGAPPEPTLEASNNYLYLPPAPSRPSRVAPQLAPPQPVADQSKHSGVLSRIFHVFFG
jgi:hypothetical protein